MKHIIQAIMAVPISDTIGKSFGKDSLVGTGVALVAAQFVLRSFFGMVVLGVVAGGLHYLQQHETGEGGNAGTGKPGPLPQLDEIPLPHSVVIAT